MATTAAEPAVAGSGLSFAHLVRLGAALATAGAGFLHLDAAGDHTEHAHIAAFFIAAGVAQLACAAAMAPKVVAYRGAIHAAMAINGALIATWILSRTVGFGFVPGIDGPEELGWKDVAASSLELTAMASLALAAVMPAAAGAALLGQRLAQRIVAGMAAATLALVVPGVLVAHEHGAHGLGGSEEAAAHLHGDPASAVQVHDHNADSATAADDHTPEHDSSTEAAGTGHVHGGVTPGRPTSSSDHPHTAAAGSSPDDHAHGAESGSSPEGHAHGTDPASAASWPAARDPLAGPGNVSTLRIGPIPLAPSVPGLEMPHLSPAVPFVGPGRLNVLPLVGIPTPCKDCFVLGIKPDLVYEDGSPANLDTGPMLHHAMITDPSKEDPVCGRDTLLGLLGRRVFAVGNERTGGAMPDGFGVAVGNGTWGGALELMNMSTQLRVVYLQATVRWVPRSTPGISPVTPVWLDVDSCGDSEVDIGGGVTDLPWDWTSNLTGRIVAAGGHVHNGGEWLALHNQTTGEHACTSVAGYGTKPQYMGSVESMSFCGWDRLGTVRAGEVLRINAHYNTAAPQKGVMGIMMIFVHETDDLTAGTPSPYPAEPPPDGAPPDAGHRH